MGRGTRMPGTQGDRPALTGPRLPAGAICHGYDCNKLGFHPPLPGGVHPLLSRYHRNRKAMT